MSIQEAIYRALGLKMSMFSDIVKFISTAHPERREGLLKSNLDDLEEDEKIFHNSIHDYYMMRPHGIDGEIDWDSMCLADFTSLFTLGKKRKNGVMLQDKKTYVTKRSRSCVIRYFLKYVNEEEHYRALLILFYPFRNEMKEIHNRNVKDLYCSNMSVIEENRAKYEKHKVLLECLQEAEKNNEFMNLDDSDEEDEYIEEETTTEKDIEDFEKTIKKQAERSVANYNAGRDEKMDEKDYLDMIRKLNANQREIFNDFCERIDSHGEDNFYLYIGGEAGTGKSYLMKCMIEATQFRGKRAGRELDKPVCLTLAPTGVAAFLINGVTIESGLALQPSKRNYVQNPESRNSNLRFLYEDLLCIFLDEVSMVGSDQLAKMNYRMQEIMGNTEFFGGVSVVSTGDFGQLPPVRQKMIWNTSFIDGRIDISLNHWDYFRIYYLKQKMRSQDEVFSRICDKVRIGEVDEEVEKYLNDRVEKCQNEDSNEHYASGKLLIIVTSNEERNRINQEKLEKLLPDKQSYFAHATDKSTNIPNAPAIPSNVPLTRTGQLQKTLELKECAPVMITSNHPKAKYKNNGLVNGARGQVDSVQMSKDDPNVAEVVWVRFCDNKVGQLLRNDSKHLLEQHKPNDPFAVPILRQKKQFQGKGNTEYMRENFPLTLSYCVTDFKSQGQTLEEAIVDYRNSTRINKGSFYTSISRVKLGSDLYLKDFKTTYIQANPEVEKMMSSMKVFRPYVFKKINIKEKIFIDSGRSLKIGYLNINNIFKHLTFEMLNEDDNLLNLDYMVVSDTRSHKETTTENIAGFLKNWSIIGRYDSKDAIRHLGMLVLKSKFSSQGDKIDLHEKQYFKKNVVQMQVVFANFMLFGLRTALVYIRETPTVEQIKILNRDLKNIDLVIGDLNLDLNRDPDSDKLKMLCQHRKRVLTEVTTTRYNQLGKSFKYPTNPYYITKNIV